MEEQPTQDKPRYRTYRRRWLVLLTAALLSLTNNALFISYSAVAIEAAGYFQKSANEIDLLATIGFYVGIPMCLVSTFVVDALGFRAGILLGTSLTFLGGFVRCLSTFPGLNESMSLDQQFILSVAGQAVRGMGNPIAMSLPTKVSQNWFPESERLLATGILAMSLPLGFVFGQGFTPLFVKGQEDIPLMNIIWFIPSALTMVFTIAFIRTSDPPSPPSKSAELSAQKERKTFREYLANMKDVFINSTFMILFLVIGGAIGFFNAFSTQMSQLMCARGYDNVFSGVCGSLLLGTGFIGAIITGTIVKKYERMGEVTKLFYGFTAIVGVLVAEFMRMSDMQVYLALLCSLFGICGFGMYPLGLELSVEATYPVDQSIGTALIFMSGQIQGGILVFASEMLEGNLEGEDLVKQVCSSASSRTPSPGATTSNPPTLDSVGKDHTYFLRFIAGYLFLLCLIFIIFFKTTLKRSLADQEHTNAEQCGFLETTN